VDGIEIALVAISFTNSAYIFPLLFLAWVKLTFLTNHFGQAESLQRQLANSSNIS
jgi:hypothetical protein